MIDHFETIVSIDHFWIKRLLYCVYDIRHTYKYIKKVIRQCHSSDNVIAKKTVPLIAANSRLKNRFFFGQKKRVNSDDVMAKKKLCLS
ncbi:hypothetical protein RclHR1_01490004 [Rhizophagus clarus]|uniref:Uncharacterized protein n=1 Tax=Rhizophagus clarus TaxID=94130 RepID=A0A2Z6QDR7_9GLOM|nr:hypothetical protein RclHR1_01490004 [Rhizophagus clarus]